jgi:hypothetical protein
MTTQNTVQIAWAMGSNGEPLESARYYEHIMVQPIGEAFDNPECIPTVESLAMHDVSTSIIITISE